MVVGSQLVVTTVECVFDACVVFLLASRLVEVFEKLTMIMGLSKHVHTNDTLAVVETLVGFNGG